VQDPNTPPTLAERIDRLLPQTQCTKCGYGGCAPYSRAIADGTALYNRCPPGGREGVERIARLLGRPPLDVDPECGVERSRPVAFIDESVCIGCTLCLQACPVDAIAGAPKLMHTVIAELCTGCDLCVAPCPVDCIDMIAVTGEATGWRAWSPAQADASRARYAGHNARLEAQRVAAEQRAAARIASAAAAASRATTGDAENDEQAKKRAIIAAAVERARRKREEMEERGKNPSP
jgi:electron transport complex protein RnfB